MDEIVTERIQIATEDFLVRWFGGEVRTYHDVFTNTTVVVISNADIGGEYYLYVKDLEQLRRQEVLGYISRDYLATMVSREEANG